MNAFKYWKTRFDKNDLLDFSKTSEGLLWLKLRSIDRTALLAEFCADIGHQPTQRITAELIWQVMSSKKAFGKIKNVDFFVDDFPFDLKVTYLPREYAALIRKRLGIDDPLRVLKSYARKHGIRFSPEDGPEQLCYEITEQMKDSSSSEAKSVLASIDGNWAQTVKCIMDDRRDLIKWLYENQGDMRFGAENRIFLVLIDMKNPDDSWKLKRNVDLMSPMISRWVSNFKRNKAHGLLTEFSFKSQKYKTYADVIFVIKK